VSHYDDEFQRIVQPEFPQNSQPEYIDPTPYGGPPVKPGLTKRGKAGIAVVTAVIAGGSLIGWTHYSAQQDAAENKAQELALKQQELRLKELEILGEQATQNAKTQTALEQARQKQVDACVTANKGLVGKQLGATYRSVLEDCQAQYGATNSVEMQAAASATGTGGSGGGQVSPGVLIGGAVLAGGLIFAVRNGRRNPA
jgi:hypothetical protein